MLNEVVARHEAIQGSKLCSLDCFVPRNDAICKFIVAVSTEGTANLLKLDQQRTRLYPGCCVDGAGSLLSDILGSARG